MSLQPWALNRGWSEEAAKTTAAKYHHFVNKPWSCKLDFWFNFTRGLKITIRVGIKVMKKTHDSWINSYFLASERSISMRFSIFSSSIFLHSQNYKRFAIPTMKIRIEIFDFEEFHLSKWRNPQLEMFVLRKGTVQIGQKCVDSLSKRLIHISFIEIQVQIGLLLEISEAGTLCRSNMR